MLQLSATVSLWGASLNGPRPAARHAARQAAQPRPWGHAAAHQAHTPCLAGGHTETDAPQPNAATLTAKTGTSTSHPASASPGRFTQDAAAEQSHHGTRTSSLTAAHYRTIGDTHEYAHHPDRTCHRHARPVPQRGLGRTVWAAAGAVRRVPAPPRTSAARSTSGRGISIGRGHRRNHPGRTGSAVDVSYRPISEGATTLSWRR